MPPPDPAFTAIILAARRDGTVDPLAAQAGVPNKCLVPIAGTPLIRHVVEALAATPGLSRMRIVIEDGSAALVEAALPAGPVPRDYVTAASNLADSVHAAAVGIDQPMLVTTADNVLLTPAAVRSVLGAAILGGGAALALAAEASVHAAHPQGQRRFYRFADGAYSNCNLYAFAGSAAIAAVESFRSGGQFAKKPLRLLVAIGPISLVLFLTRRLSLAGAFRRLSRNLRLAVRPIVLADGAHAIDVDNARTYAAANDILERRVRA